MNKMIKKTLAIVLSLLMIVCSVPFVAFGLDTTGTLTLKTDVTAEGIDIADDVAFTYDVVLGGEAYNGTAYGDDGNTYDVVDGKVMYSVV